MQNAALTWRPKDASVVVLYLVSTAGLVTIAGVCCEAKGSATTEGGIETLAEKDLTLSFWDARALASSPTP
jgi:hypothetical protein